ncbi:hypothetical protein BRE01_55540 [Brevibacillus reuszeri]|uniref:Uncharacterized protein n=1 Tax=Brevibacillus reuszeri TaxID=54915 RepID=A0A0K9YP33_9BACL|nr:hypothetical protein [Brevibacillus reuszeri]KNB70436.1 hypothetical protein ADS79_16010 [Brevibacillus reuszeri]MED1857975.1 hypothetical protein [Brevibacillus reuszeri]GED71852.1 hypothetical protein BRE01_55540 [Brevibacillus reuszeri]
MGVAYNLTCKRCSYNQNVFLGIGFRYMYLTDILEWYEEPIGKERLREFSKDEITKHVCYHGLYLCNECKFLLNAVYLHLESHSDIYTNRYNCPRCSGVMPAKPIDDEIEAVALACPDCGHANLVCRSYMDWD